MPFYRNEPDGWQQGAQYYAKSPTGWKMITQLYRKSGTTTWGLRESFDYIHPGRPSIIGTTVNSTNRSITVVARMPMDADMKNATLKYSSALHPPQERGAEYTYSDVNLQNRKNAGPGATVTWTWSPGQYDRTYYISVWAVDQAGNPSDRARTQVLIPSPKAAPPPTRPTVPKIIKVTQNPVTSGSMERTGTWANRWSSWAGDLVIQAGTPNFGGGWFYGTRIRSALSGKTKINKMTIRIQRVNSQHGISAGATLYLAPHRLSDKTATLAPAATPVNIGTLTRGQTKTFNVPSAWWPHFLSGTYRGLALWSPSSSGTAWTHSSYIQVYGRGTTSGQIYIEAQ